MGNDPPGQFTRVLHPRVGRHGEPPPGVIPIGRSVIVPANGSLPNIILSPRSILRIRRVLAREGFDVLHLHEPMTPTPCIATLALFDGPMVGTHHASGDLGWMRLAKPVWGFLEERLDRRIAVSEQARASAQRWLPGEYEIVPNGVLIPDGVEPGGREHRIVFAGRQEPRKGLQVLLRAWPEIRRATGARLRIAGADPLARAAAADAAPRAGRRHRRARFPQPGRPDGRARLREGARRAVARRRELRDGAHARVRLRDAGRRVGHPRLPGRDDAGDAPSPSSPTIRPRSRARSRRCSPTRRRARRAARLRGSSRSTGTRGRTSPGGSSGSTTRHAGWRARRRWPREVRPAEPLAVRWRSGCRSSPSSPRCSGGAVPTGTSSTTRSTSSTGRGSRSRSG